MSIARITHSGRVTIPKRVREALAIENGDSVFFLVEEGRAILFPIKKKSLSAFRGVFKVTRPYPGIKVIRQELLATLEEARALDTIEAEKLAARIRAELAATGKQFSNSAELIRKDRER